MTRAEWEALVEYTLNIGRQMMECGAEAWRAENTMARIFRAYDLEVLDAHVIATQAAVTVKTPTGEHYTSTCMILPDKTGTDLGRLETLNAAARHICDAPPPLEELPLCLKRPVARWSWRELLGYLLGAGAFAIFFGGVFLDGVAAGAIGGVVYLMEQVRRVHQQNKIIYTVVACFLAGLLAQACVGIGFGVNLDLIMIGDIMLFIPGLVIVNGVREFFYADILTGLYRLVEALLIAGAIAAGYAVSLMMGGSLWRRRDTDSVRRFGDAGLRPVLPCPSPPSAPGHLGRCAVLAAVSSGAGPGRECISQCVGGLHGGLPVV